MHIHTGQLASTLSPPAAEVAQSSCRVAEVRRKLFAVAYDLDGNPVERAVTIPDPEPDNDHPADARSSQNENPKTLTDQTDSENESPRAGQVSFWA